MLSESSEVTVSFLKVPTIYLVRYEVNDEYRYRLYVSIALGSGQTFTLPSNPSVQSGCDVYEVQLSESGEASSSLLSMQTYIKSEIEASCDAIEVRLSEEGGTTRKAKMRYADADHPGVGG